MSVRAMRAVVARLLTDAAYQGRFFSDDPARHMDYGLAQNEFDALRRIDRAKLGIVSEGYVSKRFERVESCFPRTLRTLEVLDPDARERYLALTPFPGDDAAERATFLGHIRSGPGRRWPDDLQRCLEDLAALEALLYDTPRPPGPPDDRLEPARTRPRRTPYAAVFRSQGLVTEAWAASGSGKASPMYPARPTHWLVRWDGSALGIEPLPPSGLDLLEACDGQRTVAGLEATFGPDAPGQVGRWLRRQVVADASGRTT